MVFEASGATLPIIIGAAVIDSINPCAFGVLIFILAYLTKISKQKTKVLAQGLGYVVGVYLTYFVLGVLVFLTITNLLDGLRASGITNYFYQAIGAIIILFGLLEFKEVLLPGGKGPRLAIMPKWAARVKKGVNYFGKLQEKNILFSIGLAVAIGFLVALVELPCTGAPYLAVITLLERSGVGLGGSIPFLLLYNIIFILPLLAIIIFVYKGSRTESLKQWKNEHKWLMRIAAGVLLLFLGLFIFFFDFFFGG